MMKTNIKGASARRVVVRVQCADNGTSGLAYFLIYHTYHIFGLYDNIYVTYIYDKYD